MDPDQAWKDLCTALAAGDWQQVEDTSEGLYLWLMRGGVAPKAESGESLDSGAIRGVLTACYSCAQRHLDRNGSEV